VKHGGGGISPRQPHWATFQNVVSIHVRKREEIEKTKHKHSISKGLHTRATSLSSGKLQVIGLIDKTKWVLQDHENLYIWFPKWQSHL